MKRAAYCLLAVALAFGACNREATEPQPLKALKSSQPLVASNYGPEFWADQYKRKTELWREASDYCGNPNRRHTENCQILLSVQQQPSTLGTPIPYSKSWSAPGEPAAGVLAPSPPAPVPTPQSGPTP